MQLPLLVGRRLDGVPLDLTPIGSENDFSFGPRSGDPSGIRCPLGAHVRGINDRTVSSSESLLLRRGVPYGPPVDGPPSECQKDDGVDRGLYWLSYQSSIERQFETLQGTWANRISDGFADPLIGDVLRSGTGDVKSRTLGGGSAPFSARNDWVLPTGGVYLFVPSISTLKRLAHTH